MSNSCYSLWDGGSINERKIILVDVNWRIQVGCLKWRRALSVLCDTEIPLKLKGIY